MNKGIKIRKNNTSGELITRYNEDIKSELDKYPSVITIPVQWGLQDTNQHLNNVNWLRFVESGRTDYTTMLSLFMQPEKFFELVSGKGKGMVVKGIEINFIKQVSYPDSLTIATRVTSLNSSKLEFNTKLYSLANDNLAGECTATMLCYDFKEGKRCDFAPELISAFEELENDPLGAQELALNLPTRINSNL
ncbi:Thioesterase/thiol ester dehydrase-isomerase [Conidiobolus coronatus NRRL 28638]|uniref:Thioesterase/thiol ester dehydrase-isomerase n=1 Tax=Conidiobolus coronatus (strain ATCC 28846 / CBS 209.66 / NRRL 28638) TaxID=796925 RepID=A0A137PAI4_CONC2|nr:Thioesterase/thiol ester dehydrase-isomerase [Conidiobolus coronatus NRRL 28638]|eukprot:KXN71941.1 Thioesterase/thiol ester dehydrase-isomerase [Conidiobolus coronatus NRRL 28638]